MCLTVRDQLQDCQKLNGYLQKMGALAGMVKSKCFWYLATNMSECLEYGHLHTSTEYNVYTW